MNAAVREQLRSLDDGDVIAAFLAGEDRAFEDLVDRYQTRLMNFTYRMTGDRERAEDLVQETFLRIYRHLHRFDRSKKFSTWIHTIAANLAKNEIRSRSRSPLVLFQTLERNRGDEDGPLQFEDPASRADDLFRRRRLETLVENSLLRLPPHHRQVLVLREQGKSYEEIADISACTLGTVKSRLNRARNALASILGPHLE